MSSAGYDVVELYGAYHHYSSSRPRYRLNTNAGRLETVDETADPTPFCEVNEKGEPTWGNGQIYQSVAILTNDEGQVISILDPDEV